MSETDASVYDRSFARNLGILRAAEQERLAASTVSVAGLGGIGGNVVMLLARMGVGGFRIADFDRFELANINRQFGAGVDTVGQLKCDVIAAAIRSVNPSARVEVFPEGFTGATADALLAGADVAVDAVDFYSIQTHVDFHRATRRHQLYTLMGSPIGFSACLQVFDPNGMTLEEYCGIEPAMDPLEMQLRYACSIVPELAHIDYYDVSKAESNTDFSARTGPSLACACGLAASLVATEAAVLLLRRRHSRAVPHTVQFDPYTYRYERTFVPGGMTNFDPAPLLERITDRSSLVPQVLDHLYGKPNAPRAEVNGVKLFWRSEVVSTADDPETVVFASPLGGDSSFWSRQVTELLRQGYRVITYDGRGTGVSSPWPVPCSMPLLADDLVGLLEQADTGPVHLVGLALGAAVTAEVVSRRPDLVRDLVLVSAYARADERILADTGRWRELARTEGMEALFEFCLPQLFTAEYIDANRIELDKLKTFFRLTLQDPESFSQLSLAGVAYDAGPALSRITCPALVVHGADDGLVGVELAQDVAARLPDARCVVLPRAAHFLPWEAADRFNATLVEFLAGVTTPLS